jgi:PAS domain S-box-containing protein
MLIARDVMRKDTPSLSFDQTVSEAINFLKRHTDSFVAVKASEDRYQGVLTEANLVRIFLRLQNHPDKQALIFYRDCFEPLQLIQEGEKFPEIVKKIMTSVGNRVFVIDEESKVVGHITARDILPYFTAKGIELGKDVMPSLVETLKSELYLYESFFEKSPFMMHSVTSNGVIQMANEILHSILGYSYGELIGRTIFDLYPKENHKKAEEGIRTILDQGFHSVVVAQMITKTGGIVDVEMASRALVDQANKPIGTMTASRPLKMELLLKNLQKLSP